MPKAAVETSSRLSLRVRPEDKALLMRAGALTNSSLTDFVLRNARQAAKEVIAEAEAIALSERDTQRVLNALENPPAPNARLMAAARALPKQS